MKKAFTLAEVMVVLTVIGVLVAILLPAGLHSAPDEDVVRFKKAHNVLGTTISELSRSDQYYKDGDLGIRANGTRLTHSSVDRKYFCQTIADVVSTKSVSCTDDMTVGETSRITVNAVSPPSDMSGLNFTIVNAKKKMDEYCKASPVSISKEIITVDDVYMWETRPVSFGETKSTYTNADKREFGGIDYAAKDQYGNDATYKMFCIDIDGVPDSATSSNCVNECPFGYGIRADGKLMTGARADEWLLKPVQGN